MNLINLALPVPLTARSSPALPQKGTKLTTAPGTKQGVILPLTAIIIGVILFILIAIGIDVRFARGARAKATLHLEEACRQAARQLPITRNAVEVLQGQMRVLFMPRNSGGLGGIPLAKNVGLRVFSPTLSRNLAANSATPALNQAPCPFGNASGVACRFFGNLNVSQVANVYPREPFWNVSASSRQRNNIMGDAIGCELSMRMDTFLGEESLVIARSTWQLKPRGAGRHLPVNSLPALGVRQQRGGGLLIGIATEMAVRVKEGATINTRYLLTAPTADPVTPIGAASTAFRGNRQQFDWSGTNLLPSAALTPAASNTGPLELEERRANCANPAVFVRNTMLTAIVERAARGWLRDKTEIVSINPITFNSPTLLTTSGESPTIIVRGGEDLTSPTYQLPGFTFSDTRSGLTTRINPTQRGSAAQLGDRERFGQLRDCFHVYSVGSGGTRRPVDVTVANYVDRTSFEHASIRNQTEATTPAPSYTPGVTLEWEQGLTATRGLTAGQAVSMLGATRYCPSGPTLTYPTSTGTATYSCPQPALRTTTSTPYTDLRPDVIGFLDYALGASRAYPMPGPSNPSSPGSGTLQTFSNFSHVLLFSHVPLTQAEVPEISNKVRALNINGRFVTVVYIPTNLLDATNTEITRYKQAFLAADPTVVGSQSSPNVVFHLWPRDGGFTIANQDAAFRALWANLLSASGPNNAVSRAKWLWLPRIMYEELKF